MTIQSRVKNLEQAVGIGAGRSGECNCLTFKHEIRTYLDAEDNHLAADADDAPPKLCDVCGKPRELIKVILVYTRGEIESAREREAATA
jgi:hypothetical protein